jgi:hypothetical protein
MIVALERGTPSCRSARTSGVTRSIATWTSAKDEERRDGGSLLAAVGVFLAGGMRLRWWSGRCCPKIGVSEAPGDPRHMPMLPLCCAGAPPLASGSRANR